MRRIRPLSAIGIGKEDKEMKKRNMVLLLILSLIFVGCSTTNTTKDEEKEKTEILVVDTVPNRNSFESVKTGDDEKETVVEEEKEENTDTTISNNTGSSPSDSGSSSNTGNSGNSGSSNSGNSGNTKTCTKTVHHDAVTHVEHHDAVVIHHDAETHEVYHEGAGYTIWVALFIDDTKMYSEKCYTPEDTDAFCAICDEYQYSHKNENGSWIGYSLQTAEQGNDEGYTETVVDKEAWDEVVQEAYDETVVDQAAWDEVVSYEC